MTNIRSVKTIGVEDRDLNRIQDNIISVVNQIGGQPVLNGVLLDSVVLVAASETLVYHNLGRAYRGWIVVKKRPKTGATSTAIKFWDSDVPVALKSRAISMGADVDCTVSLWVF